MIRRFAVLALLPVLFTVGCSSSSSPSTTQTASFLAPLAPLQVQPLLANSPVLPTGTVTMVPEPDDERRQRNHICDGRLYWQLQQLSDGVQLNNGVREYRSRRCDRPSHHQPESHAGAGDIRR